LFSNINLTAEHPFMNSEGAPFVRHFRQQALLARQIIILARHFEDRRLPHLRTPVRRTAQ
jgi:hypothetical protein